jgi:hypothetical protein
MTTQKSGIHGTWDYDKRMPVLAKRKKKHKRAALIKLAFAEYLAGGE